MIITKRILIEHVQMYLDEMAYPTDFDIPTFKSIRSFKGRLDYAKQHLLAKLGAGSGRAVFKIDEEKVMKVAMNQKGLEQNSEEAEGYKQNYDIIAKVFDIDNDYTWIEMELAKKISPSRFKQLTGLTMDILYSWLLYQKGTKWHHIPDEVKALTTEDNEFLDDLWQFIGDYDYPAPGDFAKTSSYGEVLRNGQPRVVLIDFGFSSRVSDTYAQARKKREDQERQRQINAGVYQGFRPQLRQLPLK